MNKPIVRFVHLVVLTWLVGSSVQAEIPAEEKIELTDPAVKRSLGAGEDEVVYLWSRGSYGPELDAFVSATAAGLPAGPGTLQPEASGQTNHFAFDGDMMQESPGFVRGDSGFGGNLYCVTGSTSSWTHGQVQVHNGAGLIFFRVWGNDDCASDDLRFLAIETCQDDFAPGAPSSTVLGMTSTTGQPGQFSQLISFSPAIPIDNQSCTYSLRARFDDSEGECSCDLALTLQKVRAQYRSSSEGGVHPVAEPF